MKGLFSYSSFAVLQDAECRPPVEHSHAFVLSMLNPDSSAQVLGTVLSGVSAMALTFLEQTVGPETTALCMRFLSPEDCSRLVKEPSRPPLIQILRPYVQKLDGDLYRAIWLLGEGPSAADMLLKCMAPRTYEKAAGIADLFAKPGEPTADDYERNLRALRLLASDSVAFICESIEHRCYGDMFFVSHYLTELPCEQAAKTLTVILDGHQGRIIDTFAALRVVEILAEMGKEQKKGVLGSLKKEHMKRILTTFRPDAFHDEAIGAGDTAELIQLVPIDVAAEALTVFGTSFLASTFVNLPEELAVSLFERMPRDYGLCVLEKMPMNIALSIFRRMSDRFVYGYGN